MVILVWSFSSWLSWSDWYHQKEGLDKRFSCSIPCRVPYILSRTFGTPKKMWRGWKFDLLLLQFYGRSAHMHTCKHQRIRLTYVALYQICAHDITPYHWINYCLPLTTSWCIETFCGNSMISKYMRVCYNVYLSILHKHPFMCAAVTSFYFGCPLLFLLSWYWTSVIASRLTDLL